MIPSTRAAEIAEEFLFLATLLGEPAAFFRVCDSYGLSPETVRGYLHHAGIHPETDARQVPA